MLAVFHVSLSGDDANDGSAANPFRTIQAAIDAAAAVNDGADEVRVAGGDYAEPGVDLGIDIPDDAALESLDLLGGFDTGFAVRDLANTPTNYSPQGAGAQVIISDAETIVDGFNFSFDGTAEGIVVSAPQTSLIDLFVTNAVDGIRVINTDFTTLQGVNASGNVDHGFRITGEGTLTLADLTLKSNGSGTGGLIDGVSVIYYTATTGLVNDHVLVTGSTITHTIQTGTSQFTLLTGSTTITHARAGDSQQPISTTSDVFHVSVNGGDGDDTIVANGAFLYTHSFITIPGPYGGLHAFGGDGNDLLVSTGVATARSNSSGPVPHFFYGEGGSDTLSIDTGSGFDDIIEADGYSVLVWYGPDPQANSLEHHEHRDIEVLNLLTAGGNDTVVVTEPPTGPFPAAINIATQDENDGVEINLGRPSTDTTFQIDGGGGSNGLTVFTRSRNDNTLDVDAGQVVIIPRAAPGNLTEKAIHFENLRGLNLLADDGHDLFTVRSLNLGPGFERLALFGQNDNDIANVNLSDPATSAWLQFDGGAGADNRLIVLGDSATNHHFTVDSRHVQARLGTDPFSNPIKHLEYGNAQTLQILGADGNDTFTVSQSSPTDPVLPQRVSLVALGGDDRVSLDTKDIPGSVEIELELGDGDDTADVNVSAASIKTTVLIQGGSEAVGDLLRVHADAGGSNVAVGTFSSHEHLRVASVELLVMNGGSGKDEFRNNTSVPAILDGLGGHDVLTGGTARDLLIGGGGFDQLEGEEEEDLLISGPVTFDLHQLSLLAILSEWISSRSFDERVANLSGTGTGPRNNGDVFLQPVISVFDEGPTDTVGGGAGEDWLLADLARDTIRQQTVVFDVSPLESQITVSGSVFANDGSISARVLPQSTGSLTANIQGTIRANVTEESIEFVEGTALDPIEQPGPFLPGNLPADVAGQLIAPQGYAAMRGLLLTGLSAPISFGQFHRFAADQVTLQTTEGFFAVDIPGFFTSSYDIGNLTTANQVTTEGQVNFLRTHMQLTLPIEFAVIEPVGNQSFMSEIRAQGTIVARSVSSTGDDLTTDIALP